MEGQGKKQTVDWVPDDVEVNLQVQHLTMPQSALRMIHPFR